MKKADQTALLQWYEKNKRPFPWRETKKPYPIWISETMLQQTTTTAVLPFYKRFLKSFPTLKSLAMAPESKVLENWAGLGYYSRARNLHKAAKELMRLKGFPKTYSELIQLPGFGPYTSRAVSSLAFGENVGVLDGNVIRVLSRKHNAHEKWWTTSGRSQLQEKADAVVKNFTAGEMNQALMELGATICLPKNPQCLLCPWLKTCKARKAKTELKLPLKKTKRDREIWVWQAQVIENKGHIKIIKNNYAPFLKKQWFLPGEVKKLRAKPKSYDFRHSITHHDIYIQVQKIKTRLKTRDSSSDLQWVRVEDVRKVIPASLIHKALQIGQ